jgi:hypothetical protein
MLRMGTSLWKKIMLVGVAAVVAVIGVHHTAAANTAVPASVQLSTLPPDVLRFDVQGEAVTAQYADADGVHLSATVGGDIQVTGRVVWATVAVYGQDIGCSILINGITVGNPNGSVTDGAVNTCTYVRGYEPQAVFLDG